MKDGDILAFLNDQGPVDAGLRHYDMASGLMIDLEAGFAEDLDEGLIMLRGQARHWANCKFRAPGRRTLIWFLTSPRAGAFADWTLFKNPESFSTRSRVPRL